MLINFDAYFHNNFFYSDTCDSTKYVCQVLYHHKKGINHWVVSLAFVPKEKLNVSTYQQSFMYSLMTQLYSQRDQPLYEDALIGPSSEFQFVTGSNIIKLEFRMTTEWNVSVYSDLQQVHVCYVIKVVA